MRIGILAVQELRTDHCLARRVHPYHALIDERVPPVLLGNLGELLQRCDIAVHTENTIGDDPDVFESAAFAGKKIADEIEIPMRVYQAMRPRGAASVDQRGMIELRHFE